MPMELAEQVRSVRDRIPGERKHVTVMFADIKGSTEMTEAGDIEDAYSALEGAVRLMSA